MGRHLASAVYSVRELQTLYCTPAFTVNFFYHSIPLVLSRDSKPDWIVDKWKLYFVNYRPDPMNVLYKYVILPQYTLRYM